MNYDQLVKQIGKGVLSGAVLLLHVCGVCDNKSNQESHTSRSKKATEVVSWVGLNDYHVNTWMECKQSKLVGLAREQQSALTHNEDIPCEAAGH
jgi:hypothetical protein